MAGSMPDGVEVVVESKEADHVHGLCQACLVNVHDRIGPFGKEYIHQLVTACRCVLEPVPANMLCRSAACDRTMSSWTRKRLATASGPAARHPIDAQQTLYVRRGMSDPVTHLMFAGLKAPAMPLRTSRHHSSVSPETKSGCPLDPIICASQHLPVNTGKRALRRTAQLLSNTWHDSQPDFCRMCDKLMVRRSH